MSIGNVPQLASDLIIHTFKLERVGFLDDDSVMPVSGVREDTDLPGTTVPIEGNILTNRSCNVLIIFAEQYTNPRINAGHVSSNVRPQSKAKDKSFWTA